MQLTVVVHHSFHSIVYNVCFCLVLILQADVICVVYACDNDDSIARVNSIKVLFVSPFFILYLENHLII